MYPSRQRENITVELGPSARKFVSFFFPSWWQVFVATLCGQTPGSLELTFLSLEVSAWKGSGIDDATPTLDGNFELPRWPRLKTCYNRHRRRARVGVHLGISSGCCETLAHCLGFQGRCSLIETVTSERERLFCSAEDVSVNIRRANTVKVFRSKSQMRPASPYINHLAFRGGFWNPTSPKGRPIVPYSTVDSRDHHPSLSATHF